MVEHDCYLCVFDLVLKRCENDMGKSRNHEFACLDHFVWVFLAKSDRGYFE